MTARVAVIAGDGIGPEVIAQALRVLDELRQRGVDVEVWELPLGAEQYLKDGTTFPLELRDEVRRTCAAVLLGAVGDPRVPGGEHAHDILLGMRTSWDLYANVRPVRALHDRLVPLRDKTRHDVDLVIYRENTEGQYVGAGREHGRGTAAEIAISREVHTRRGVERLLRAAFDFAQERGWPLVMTDKSNAIPAQGIWRRVLAELRAEYPSVVVEQLYVDALAARLIEHPERHRVIAASNLFGDILADQCAALAGGLGLAPSANVHPAAPGHIGLFEPVHGSAPDIAGRGLANPLGAIRSLGLLVAHLGHAAEAARIERAAEEVLARKECTPDVGGTLGTVAAGQAFIDVLRAV
ncbi:MAG: isocitrate/isopropylmalate dehydrogenase family protein [Myxococcales bacterium]|nr:MAG: isocitrate/isopropylmalate dehydrogenase family protein [Myxococcales bacterium]